MLNWVDMGVHIFMWACMGVFALTTFWHHTLLCFYHLSPTNRAIRWGHFHHPFPSFHAKPTGGTAYIPFTPFSNQATAWNYASRNIYNTYHWSGECVSRRRAFINPFSAQNNFWPIIKINYKRLAC